MKFPAGMRPATLEERRIFYTEEFDEKRAKRWVRSFVKVDTGRHSGIVKPGMKPKLLMLKPWKELRERVLHYLPEDVYYDRNRYRSLNLCANCRIFFRKWRGAYCWWKCPNFTGQELAFDVDPENVNLGRKRDSIYSFTEEEFEETRLRAIELYEWLRERFRKVIAVYSGRGFHLVVQDREAELLSMKEREKLVERLPPKLQEIVDPWVTRGNIRLLRLPYTLHGLVSRVVTPLKRKDMERDDLLYRFKPKFLD